MTIQTSYVVRCDGCGRLAEDSTSEAVAIEHAIALGWAVNADEEGTDLCVGCAKQR